MAKFYFKEDGCTIWLTADQYTKLKAAMEQSVQEGFNPAGRLKGFGPAPNES